MGGLLGESLSKEKLLSIHASAIIALLAAFDKKKNIGQQQL